MKTKSISFNSITKLFGAPNVWLTLIFSTHFNTRNLPCKIGPIERNDSLLTGKKFKRNPRNSGRSGNG